MTVADRDWYLPLRAELPVLERYTYLNTGTAGPIPRCSARALAEEAAHELESGRGNFADFDRLIAARGAARSEAAQLLGAEPEEVALTHHSSEGINIILASLDWKPGDGVVTTSLEHDAGAVPLGLLRRRAGVDLRFAEIGLGERALDGLEAALDGQVRLVLLSHIVYTSGAVLPLGEMIAMIRQRAPDSRVLVDGAQTCGVMPLDVKQLDADYYTLSGQKWICGPEGTGALFVRADRLDELVPGYSSYFSAQQHDFRGNVTLHPTARRFETGMIHRPSMAAFSASLAWIRREVGIERAWARSVELARACRERLQDTDGVELVTPADQQGPLVSFDLPAFSPAQIHSAALLLADRDQVICRSIDHPPYALRGSFGFFNTLQEVDRFAAVVSELVAAGPDTVPLAGHAARLPSTR